MDYGIKDMKKFNPLKMIIIVALLAIASNALAKTHTVEQANKSFQINGKTVAKLNVQLGDKINFVNKDTVYHNIFSMSKITKFNFGAFGNGESKSYSFNTVGKSIVECAIHPRMILEVDVSK